MKKVTLIAAMDENQLIGSENSLPWHLPADLKFFKQQTSGKCILMGRKTCESLPFSLPNRRNVVLSRNNAFSRSGFTLINSLDELNESEIMVIGGAKIYELMLPHATHMILTRIHKKFSGDTYFPPLEWKHWQITQLTNNPVSTENPDFAYDFIFYEKLDLMD